MLHNFRPFLSRKVSDSFVVIDPVFPQKEPLAFRNSEINEYFRKIPRAASYAMYPMQPGPDAWFSHGYGVTREVFEENKSGYLRYYPENANKLHYLQKNRDYHFELAYSFFLSETYVLLPFYQKHNIPFIFVLYPGGAFGLDNKSSDAMLRAIFESDQFRGVIVTQQITYDYLMSKKLCPASKVRYIYGGFVQFKTKEVQPKQYYEKDKSTLDICFVAAKYSERGVDKGYDLFIEVAKKVCKATDDVQFHVVGGFDEQDIDVQDIKDRIHFYGYKRPDFLLDFYTKMDIFLSPNRPGQLFPGNFDGFPLGIDASYCGAALFVSDELDMNHWYAPGKELEIIPLDVDRIADKVLHYTANPTKLYELAAKGTSRTRELFDVNYQIDQRIEVFRELGGLKI